MILVEEVVLIGVVVRIEFMALEKTIKIFNREIPIRTHYCSLFGQSTQEVQEPSVNLYVRTKYCNAKCEFCTFANTANKFNFKKYEMVLNEISKQIKIKKIAFTGGEPTLYWDNFKSMVTTAREICPEANLTMNTDGLRLVRLFEDDISKLFSNIHISRHHYDDNVNNTIFKSKTPTTKEIQYCQTLAVNPYQVQISCNIIKGFIDNKEEVFKMLEWVNSLEINNVGLVALMPVNQYSRDHFIKFNVKDLIQENFYVSKEWSYKESCECTNYVYMPQNLRKPMRVYHKNTYAPFDIQETLIFDGENIKLGFEGEIII